MAMPTIGGGNCIALITCPNSLACSSIARAICPGTSASFATLSDYSIRAGKTATPYCMSEFSAYNPNYVSLLCTGSLGTDGVSTTVNRCHSVVYSYTRTVGNTYCICFAATLCTTTQTGACAAFCVMCNSLSKLTCQIGPSLSATPSVSFVVDYNDTVSICACAIVPTSGIGCSYSEYSILQITPIVGEWGEAGITGCKSYKNYTV